uniref:Uncharacterized protein n=1 Tax=Oryza glumipatula TaxID=40148 RepID=A0A0E0A0L3_9ORYZ
MVSNGNEDLKADVELVESTTVDNDTGAPGASTLPTQGVPRQGKQRNGFYATAIAYEMYRLDHHFSSVLYYSIIQFSPDQPVYFFINHKTVTQWTFCIRIRHQPFHYWY